MAILIDEVYFIEKIEAYNVAIDALNQHEGASDVGTLSKSLRERLAKKLSNEIDRWAMKHSPHS